MAYYPILPFPTYDECDYATWEGGFTSDECNRIIELGELFAMDALKRNESCGGHFREEFQTKEGEAMRMDKEFSYVSAWENKGEVHKSKLHKENLEFYELNQGTSNVSSEEAGRLKQKKHYLKEITNFESKNKQNIKILSSDSLPVTSGKFEKSNIRKSNASWQAEQENTYSFCVCRLV